MNFRSVIFFLAIFFFSEMTAQSQDSIRTEVFVLSTCEPGSFSFIKKLNDPLKIQYTKKLEVRSNQPSAFQITGINPLRYKYYINNEAVTQFMEASPLTFSLNSFTNGDYFVTAPEIRVPEIFKTDSISSKVKARIIEFEAKRRQIEDSVEAISEKMNEYWNDKKVSDTNSSKAFVKAPEYNNLYMRLDRQRYLLDRSLKEYQMFTGNLPLNNPHFAILKQYRDLKVMNTSEIDSIKRYKKEFADNYLVHTEKLKAIEFLLIKIERMRSYDPGFRAAQDVLIDSLRYYNFSWSSVENVYYGSYDNRLIENRFQLNINDVRQQILNKRFQLYEEFVLDIATQIGVLVQNKFREYSSFNNLLENYNSINLSLLDSIKNQKAKLSSIFEFIQKTSAELQIMVSYLDINTELYQNVAKKINTNYVFLLAYLKNLEFVEKENTVQYTLPTHTNLKNIDLIRYSLKREDKITKNTQSYNYDFWLKGGVKIDFSVGFFATRLTDNVYNKVLLDTVGGIDKIRITRQDDGRANFAFGGMVNITPRNGASWISIGGSVGVAYSSNQKLQILAGLSMHLGKTERVSLNAGMAFGTIKYLDVSANDFKFYDKDLKEIPREKIEDIKEKDRVYMLQSKDIKFSSYVIPSVDKFVIRPFVGISYNLSKKNALQAVSGTGVSTFSENYKNGVTY
jgi:hypothetical protein